MLLHQALLYRIEDGGRAFLNKWRGKINCKIDEMTQSMTEAGDQSQASVCVCVRVCSRREMKKREE